MAKWQRASAEAVADAEKSLTSALVVPTNARRGSRKNPDAAWWSERVRVTDVEAEVTQTQAGDTHTALKVTCEILQTRPDGSESDNNGRTVSLRSRLNWEAANKGDKKDGQFKMHNGSIARVSQLFRSVGLFEGGEIPEELWAMAFPDEGLSPMVGAELDVEIHQEPSEDGRIFPEINKVLLPDVVASNVNAANAVTV